jgi:hypothetical protein
VRTYTTLLAELRIEDAFLVEGHVVLFKEELNKGNPPNEVYDLIWVACQHALASAATNLIQKSARTGVDDANELATGVASVTKEYEQEFFNQVKEYLN